MKSNKHEGHTRQFRIDSQSWHRLAMRSEADYAKGLDRILMGFYGPEGGFSGEFRIDWELLQEKVTPRLKAYDDGWSALAQFQDVIAGLAELDNLDPTVEQVAAVLLKCGVVDATERTRVKN